jgi:hypothetical protein
MPERTASVNADLPPRSPLYEGGRIDTRFPRGEGFTLENLRRSITLTCLNSPDQVPGLFLVGFLTKPPGSQ